MPATFSLSLPLEELDFDLCLFCGQVFRFVRTPTGFLGQDGIHGYRIGREGSEWIIEGDRRAFESLFRFDFPLDTLHKKLIDAGPELEPIISAVPGLRTMRPSDPVETFFCFLCTSNNNISRITSMISKLADFGEGFFPAPAVIAGVGEARLRELGFGYRGASLAQAAARLAASPSLMEELVRTPYEDAFKELMSFNGIGPKLADCICLFALGHTEAVPVDTHMWQAYTRLYRPDQADLHPSDRRMRDVGEFMRDRFGKLAGFAHHYMFVENLRRR